MSVLAGFAPTPEGRAALRRALQECDLRNTPLTLVVSERPGNSPLDIATCTAEIASACADLGLKDPGHEVRAFTGSLEPADDVLNVAEDIGAELIVIGLRRRSPVGKLILGGSAQRILLEANCPVLAVKGTESYTSWTSVTRGDESLDAASRRGTPDLAS
jgi:nucleotide-binding universal stress UspA family protein